MNENDIQYINFNKAIKIANEYLIEYVINLYTQWIPAYEIVKKAIINRSNNEIIILDQ